MIQYETNDSPFFASNKHYCETIEHNLKTISAECTGFCNSFGYDMETSFLKDNLIYYLKLHKHQSTQNGVIIPVDALNYAGIEVKITGINKKFKVKVGKSSLSRFFISRAYKEKIPAPYFLKFNYKPDNYFINDISEYVLANNISKLYLSRGTLFCKIHSETHDLLNLIAGLENIAKNWVAFPKN